MVLKFPRLEPTVQPSSLTEQMIKYGEVTKHKTARLCPKAVGKVTSCVPGLLRLILGNTRGKKLQGVQVWCPGLSPNVPVEFQLTSDFIL